MRCRSTTPMLRRWPRPGLDSLECRISPAVLHVAMAVDNGDGLPVVGPFQMGQSQTGHTRGPSVPPRVTNLKIDDGTIQRSMITSLTVTFSEAVTISAPIGNAFLLNRN